MIKIRTRVGFGVDRTGDAKHAMKPLSPGYIEQRKAQQSFAQARANKAIGEEGLSGLSPPARRAALQAHKGLSDETTPSKSNLTRTGQMLDSISVKKIGDGTVSVGPTGDRREGGPTNAEVAEYQEDKGRIFNRLSDIELKRLNDSIKTQLRSIIRDKLTK